MWFLIQSKVGNFLLISLNYQHKTNNQVSHQSITKKFAHKFSTSNNESIKSPFLHHQFLDSRFSFYRGLRADIFLWLPNDCNGFAATEFDLEKGCGWWESLPIVGLGWTLNIINSKPIKFVIESVSQSSVRFYVEDQEDSVDKTNEDLKEFKEISSGNQRRSNLVNWEEPRW